MSSCSHLFKTLKLTQFEKNLVMIINVMGMKLSADTCDNLLCKETQKVQFKQLHTHKHEKERIIKIPD